MVLSLGIDVGSTTTKLVLGEQGGAVLATHYARHNADVAGSLVRGLKIMRTGHDDARVRVTLTGTAGMGVAERTGLGFVQEVVACSDWTRARYPELGTLIDVGGEDAKIVFFGEQPDMRMNGNCAGGTGSFIDQMATLLGTDPQGLDTAASLARHVHPIAARCGVFAKTDVQNLVARHVSREEIAASVFRAVALQVVSSLARGQELRRPVAFAGGPLAFLPALRRAFVEVLGLEPGDLVDLPLAQFLPALGASLQGAEGQPMDWAELERRLAATPVGGAPTGALEPLFADAGEYGTWAARVARSRVGRAEPEELDGATCFVGIDSGSTTTKIVVVDARGRIALEHYAANTGDPVEAVRQGLEAVGDKLARKGVRVVIGRAAVTGYGEDLIRAVYSVDEGVVETVAHFRGAHSFLPEVTFVLDIGGQDMKAIRVRDGVLHHVEINEACSSGCGSFLSTFARGLGMTAGEFAKAACDARSPADLGTRCTVFMNSRVKQSLRDGSSAGDIAAGLAVSVVKNCFTKVLKIHDPAVLGEHIVVQGGAFRNEAVLRALEKHLGRPVIRPDVPELMGAFGAALVARETWYQGGRPDTTFVGWEGATAAAGGFRRREIDCAGCENGCRVSRLEMADGRRFFTGNRCEKRFHSSGVTVPPGENLVETRARLLFDRPLRPAGTPRLKVGIPRALNMYDRFPFWCTLLVHSGIEVVLSRPSSQALADRAAPTIISENLCYPAKLASAHVMDLLDADVDRILYPMVKYEELALKGEQNSFTCPLVLGYPDVIRSTIAPEARHGIPFDTPTVTFADDGLTLRACLRYLGTLGVDAARARRAFAAATHEQAAFRAALRQAGTRLLRKPRDPTHPLILLAGRPYHTDQLINRRVPEMIAAMGLDVLPEDALPLHRRPGLQGMEILTQWSYVNRILEAVRWASTEPDVEVVELNSFGCGPDALTYDEAREILAEHGKNLTVVRVDEITSPGSNRLRIRSMVESLRLRGSSRPPTIRERIKNRIFRHVDQGRTILAPQFSPFLTLLLQSSFRAMGYTLEVLPEPDRKSVEAGLRYANNDICYPATIVIGDIIKALRSGRYDPATTAVAISQTGGQCRASSYVSLLKKALLAAGYPGVPVVSVTLGGVALNQQPGFRISATRLLLRGLFATIYTDAISALYTRIAVREKVKGESLRALNGCLAEASGAALGRPWVMFRLLKRALRRFRRIQVRAGSFPRVGIVGEIYLKYNPFGNANIVDWLINRGIEPVVPPLLSFFVKRFVNVRFNRDHLLERFGAIKTFAYRSTERIIEGILDRVNRILAAVSLKPFHPIRRTALRARRVLSLANQYGECWLLPGEICELAEAEVRHVVSVQPFGCIANHVLAKGVERRLKDLYPGLSLLHLDMDAGSSEVNNLNRLHFLVEGARREAGATAGKG